MDNDNKEQTEEVEYERVINWRMVAAILLLFTIFSLARLATVKIEDRNMNFICQEYDGVIRDISTPDKPQLQITLCKDGKLLKSK